MTSTMWNAVSFATLHRVLTLGVHLLDTADMYTWGLHREFAAFRTTYAAQLAAAAKESDPSAARARRSPWRRGRRPSGLTAEEPFVPPSKVVEMRRCDRLNRAGLIRNVSNRP